MTALQNHANSTSILRAKYAPYIQHTLLIDDGSRYRTYCLLLIQKQNLDRIVLRGRAEYYRPEATIDLRAIVDDLIEYLETGGETMAEKLPEWEDFKQTAREYEIPL